MDLMDNDTDSDSLTPVNNPDLFGHETAESVLLDVACSGRLPHAWLITGRSGIGKATLCYRFAKILLANPGLAGGKQQSGASLFGDDLPVTKPASLRLDPQHPVNQRVVAGSHGDLKVLQRRVNEKTGKLRSEILVDDVRAIGSLMSMTAMEGGWRVIIIDAAEEMNRNAANALLKVLEEPPANTVLLLISHAPGRLLPTIRSRCRTLTLDPLTPDVLNPLIQQHRPELSPDDVERLGLMAEGSLGRALRLVDQGGLNFFNDLLKLLGLWPNFETAALHALGDRMNKKGEEEAFETLMILLRWWLARFIAATAKGEASQASSLPEEQALMARLADSASLDHWLLAWDRIGELLIKLDRANLDKKQVLLAIFGTLVPAGR